MNKRQSKKRIYKKRHLFGGKYYTYEFTVNDETYVGFTASPKEKGCVVYSFKDIVNTRNKYGHKANDMFSTVSYRHLKKILASN